MLKKMIQEAMMSKSYTYVVAECYVELPSASVTFEYMPQEAAREEAREDTKFRAR